MQVIVYLILVIFAGVSGQLQLGEPCGNNIGEITLDNNCTTAIIVSNITSATKDDGNSTTNMVCCIKTSLLTQEKKVTPDKKPMRKSEEACAKFGPGLPRNLSSSDHVQPGDYQHNVALVYEYSQNTAGSGVCNGVLINEYFVLTTAYCANPKWQYPVFKVRAGTTDLSGEKDAAIPQQIRISQTIIHPEYNEAHFIHNLALLKLAEPMKFTSYVQPVCLYTKTDVPDMLTATGWGLKTKHDSKGSNVLLRSKVIEVNTMRCNNTSGIFYKYVYDSEFCGVTDYNLCNIGFGSPVFLSNKEDSRVTLVAIESYGAKCAIAQPYVFIKIGNHLDWIESVVWP